MIVVSNSTPLIGLASLQRFDLLEQLFEQLYIAQAVYNEVVTQGREIGGAKSEVSQAHWIQTLAVNNQTQVKQWSNELDLGEAETIVLAQEINADLVLMDDKKGRRKLNELGMPMMGTLGVLLKAKEEGLLATIRADVEKLHRQKFSLSQAVMDAVLEQAGE